MESDVRSAPGQASVRVREKRLAALDAVGGDGGLTLGAGNPVDEGLAHLRLDVGVALRIDQDDDVGFVL